MLKNPEIDAIVRSDRTKSAKIRDLAQGGVSKKEIAHLLAINANHVYSIIARDRANGRRQPSREQAKPDDGEIVEMVSVDMDGRIILPPEALAVMALPPGERVVLLAHPGEIRLLSRSKAVNDLQKRLNSKVPNEAALARVLLRDIGE